MTMLINLQMKFCKFVEESIDDPTEAPVSIQFVIVVLGFDNRGDKITEEQIESANKERKKTFIFT